MNPNIFDNNKRAMINISGINRLGVDINSYALKVKKALDDINDLHDLSSSYFTGDTKDDFTVKLKSMLSHKDRMKENILSYVDDYNTVVSKFKTNDSSITFNKIS